VLFLLVCLVFFRKGIFDFQQIFIQNDRMRALLFFVFICLFLQYWKADREIVVSVQFEHELT
jgi:hypothetical protein